MGVVLRWGMPRLLFLLLFFAPNFTLGDDYEWVQPESYSIRRFQEIVDVKFQDEKEKNPSERILEKRARLEMSKRDQKGIESPSQNTAAKSISSENLTKAAAAQIQHYEILIERLEKSVIKKNEKSRRKRR